MFEIGKKYKRSDIYQILHVPSERQNGNWDTGYTSWKDVWYIFANIGVSNPSNINYANSWLDEEKKLMRWFGKRNIGLNTDSSRKLIDKDVKKHVFYRSEERDAWTYGGEATAVNINNNKKSPPIELVWQFNDNKENHPTAKDVEPMDLSTKEKNEANTLLSKTIGTLIEKRLRKEFSNSASGKRLIIVEGFKPAEVYFAVIKILKTNKNITVKITDPIEEDYGAGKLDKEFLFFKQNDTITKYRNGEKDAYNDVVVFCMSPQSDRSGTANLAKINDDNILMNDDHANDLKSLVVSAWEAATDAVQSPNVLYVEYSEKIIKLLIKKNYWTVIPLRPAAQFLAHIANTILSHGPRAKKDILKAILSNLPLLGMFTDESFGDIQSDRLEKNYLLSRLQKKNGSEHDAESLSKKAENTDFVDIDGNPIEQVKNSHWKSICSEFFLQHPINENDYYRKIPWQIITQVVDIVVNEGLGVLVRQDILSSDKSRIKEFEDLDIQEGLDSNSSEAARILINAIPEDSLRPLINIIDQQTRNRVERLARKAPKIESFSAWLTDEIYSLSENLKSQDEEMTICIDCESDGETSQLSKKLFRFIYLNTLKDISDETKSGYKFNLIIGQNLNPIQGSEIRLELEEIEDKPSDWINTAWEHLTLKLSLHTEDKKEKHLTQVKWAPDGEDMLAVMLIIASNKSISNILHWKDLQANLKDWCYTLKCAKANLGNESNYTVTDEYGECGRNWINSRDEFLITIAECGLSETNCTDYFYCWGGEDILKQALESEFKLTGHTRSEYNHFMSIDTHKSSDGITMLPIHPFKVRWIGKYLSTIKDTLLSALSDDGLMLSEKKGAYFFKQIGTFSPFQSPPYFIHREGNESKVYHSIFEYGWSETYAEIENKERQKGVIDEKCIDTLANQCLTFIEHHPHKETGVDILLALETPTDFPEKFLSKMLKLKRDVRIRLHILASAQVLAKLKILRNEGELFYRQENYQIMPSVDIHTHCWSDNRRDLPESLKNRKIDISIIPSLFSDSLKCQEFVDNEAYESNASYNALLSENYTIDLDDSSANVLIRLLPDSYDEVSRIWSTLNIQLKRSAPLGAGSDKTEYFKFKIDLQDSDELMTSLHSISLWVMTLDKYLTRNNLQNLNCNPEIINFKDDVGDNGDYNLITSAKMGENFIIPRLKRRINDLNKRYFKGELQEEEVSNVAENLFNENSTLAPGVMLRSLGGGWTLNELLGLVGSKRYLNKESNSSDCLFTAWIPLDNYTEWFGGSNTQKRADLLWLSIYKDEDESLILEPTIVESKFGDKINLTNGVDQVIQTLEVINSALTPSPKNKLEGEIWRRKIVKAIESNGSIDTPDNGEIKALPISIKDRIILGKFKIGNRSSRVVWHCPGSEEDVNEEKSGILVHKLGNASIFNCLTNKVISGDEVNEPEVRPEAEVVLEPEVKVEPEVEVIPEIEPEVVNRDLEVTSTARFEKLTLNEKKKIIDIIVGELNRFDEDIYAHDPPEEAITEGPACMRFLIKKSSGVVDERMIRRNLPLLKTALELPEGYNLDVINDRGIWIEVPKTDDQRVFVTCKELWKLLEASRTFTAGFFGVPIGVDVSGLPVLINFGDNQMCHLLIAGATGAGKSVGLETIIAGLTKYYTPKELELTLIDAKEIELADYEDCDHVNGRFHTTTDDVVTALEQACSEMDHRYTFFKEESRTAGLTRTIKDIAKYNSQFPDRMLPRQVIVIDEYADLKDRSEQAEAANIDLHIKRICQKGRAAGIHMILCTQNPSAKIVPTMLRNNFNARLAYKVKDSIASRVILDKSGAETLTGKGDALLSGGGGSEAFIRLQTAILEDEN